MELGPFILKVFSGVLKVKKKKKLDFPAVPDSPTGPTNFRFSARLIWRGVKLFNRAARLDFPNVIGPNGSN